MKTLEVFNVLESFGLESNGIFDDVSEVDMIDVVGGSCGGGSGCGYCVTCGCHGMSFGSPMGNF